MPVRTVVLFLLFLGVAAAAWLTLDERRRERAGALRMTTGELDDATASAVPPRPPPQNEAARELASIRALPQEQEAQAIARYEALLRALDGEERAVVACELAVRLHNRAVKQDKDGEHRAADIDSRRALEICPTEKRLAQTRAQLLFAAAAREDRSTREGRARAKELLTESTSLHEHANARAMLAEALYADDDVSGAVAQYERALELQDQPSWRERLADLQKKAAVEGTFSDRRHEHFVARFEGYAQERLAWLALDTLEEAYFSIGRSLDLYPKEPFTVLIYTGDQYKRAVDMPDWSSGVFDGKIRIAEGQLALDKGHLEGILRHEYTHAALSTLRTRIPTWMNEGLAEHFEGREREGAEARVMRARAKGIEITWDELNGSFLSIREGDRAGLAYATATALVASLIDSRGSYTLITLVTHLENGASFEDAFTSTYAMTPAQAFERWRGSR